MVGAVAVSFTVRVVVLGVKTDQIVERKTVVASDEIDALFGLALFVLVDIRASCQPESHCPGRSVVAL